MYTPIIGYNNVIFNETTHDDYMIDIRGNVVRRLGSKSELFEPKYVYLPLGVSNQHLYVGLSTFKQTECDTHINFFRIDELLCWFYKYDETIKVSFKDAQGRNVYNVEHINGDESDNDICNIQPRLFIEQWKTLNGFNDIVDNTYSVSNIGNVVNVVSNIKCSLSNTRGYKRIYARTKDGKPKSLKVHRLVCFLFSYDPDYNKLQVNHIDGNRCNNRIDNLEWVDTKGNSDHAWATGLNINRGTHCGSSTHSTDEVRKACEYLVKNRGSVKNTQNDLHDIGIDETESFIRHLKCKRIWRWISDEYFTDTTFPSVWAGENTKYTHVTCNEAIEVCELLVKHNGDTHAVYDELYRKYGSKIGIGTVDSIKRKTIWPTVSNKYFKIEDGEFIII